MLTCALSLDSTRKNFGTIGPNPISVASRVQNSSILLTFSLVAALLAAAICVLRTSATLVRDFARISCATSLSRSFWLSWFGLLVTYCFGLSNFCRVPTRGGVPLFSVGSAILMVAPAPDHKGLVDVSVSRATSARRRREDGEKTPPKNCAAFVLHVAFKK